MAPACGTVCREAPDVPSSVALPPLHSESLLNGAIPDAGVWQDGAGVRR